MLTYHVQDYQQSQLPVNTPTIVLTWRFSKLIRITGLPLSTVPREAQVTELHPNALVSGR